MTNQSDGFSYSVNLAPVTRPTADGPKAYGPADLMMVPLPQGRVLLKDRTSGKHAVVDEPLAGLLAGAHSMQPLQFYVDALIKVHPSMSGARPRVEAAIHQLVNDGILLSEQHFLSQWERPAAPGEMPPIVKVFIRTCNRPELLARLLASIASQAPPAGLEVVVLDDSDAANVQQRNREAVERSEAEGSISIHYHGQEAQTRLCEELKQAFPGDIDSIDWLLSPRRGQPGRFTGGRMLNHALLLSAGSRMLLLDDDAILEPRHSAEAPGALVISEAERKARFFANVEASLDVAAPLELNVLMEHGKWLGVSLAETLRTANGDKPLSLQGVPMHSVRGLAASSTAALTVNGVVGDPGTGRSDWIYRLEGDSRNRLIADAEHFAKVRLSRSAILGYEVPTVNSDMGSLMFTTALGIDNRHLMPPTSPEFRNEDLLFGAWVQFARPADFLLGLPWALPHLPESTRYWSEESLDRAPENGISGVLKDVAYNALSRCNAEGTAERLRFLSAVYSDLADSGQQSLVQGLRENRLRLHGRTAIELSTRLQQTPQAPELWKQDVQRMLNARSKAIMEQAQPLFSELRDEGDESTQLYVFRQHAQRTAQALRLWPELWSYLLNR